MTAAGLLVIGILTLIAALAPHVVPGSPTEIAKDHALRGPTWSQPFGMDDLGRSILSRVAHAYRVSLGVALASVALALLVGLPLGLVAGYAEGALDQLIMRPLDVLMAFPAILLAIALMSVFGTGVVLVAASLAVVYTPIVARVVRAAVLAVKAEIYVDGARALGAPARPARAPPHPAQRGDPGAGAGLGADGDRDPGRGLAVVPRGRRAPADARRSGSCWPTAAASWCRRPGW